MTGPGQPLTPADLLSFGEEGEWLVAEGHVDLNAFERAAIDFLNGLGYDLHLEDGLPRVRHAWMRPARESDFPDDPNGWERAQAENWQMWVDQPDDDAAPVTVGDTE
jgi:hypothetical protein